MAVSTINRIAFIEAVALYVLSIYMAHSGQHSVWGYHSVWPALVVMALGHLVALFRWKQFDAWQEENMRGAGDWGLPP